MLILGLDTSTPATSVALWEDGKLVGEVLANQRQSHSEQLVGLVKHLLETTSVSLDAIDFYACTRGPGSFTGLRIGAAAVKGFAQYHDKPIVGVSLLEITAWNAAGYPGWICPMVDAQRDQVYAGIYRWDEGRIQEEKPDHVGSIDDVMKMIKAGGDPAMCLGSGTKKIPLGLVEGNIQVMDEVFGMPRASMLCQAAAWKIKEKTAIFTWKDFEPEYFRRSQAEIQMEQRKGGGK
ncbi:tRNA (adenosine(37)-N6)-threonylcarbamoyltransferase complex dimerization subunit type 1 TsaB [Alkalibacter rhizosphaerae]|uniref:tRNA (Adenosine(37)-N6)-threonylcarbamoyltransferase complex dimerization subunit type 1 TsaB n=1 Tax=Alkalibacter rhizosphaerae TaxID=2815577 RepID=A0A974XFY5_9FIRM|nr:tRNA (adenosine(37)-N6)-threonylcarbamoyltransferase complex dimerization subunit type 1 TsaB [Alkalibacter rhizosphaerae]QSX08010.1 tRNA (adenosine(37)-N6)-threonylcarbamoyltransferase complex dimerization subunit type 1 TsaB [Alkalibacter rhizosphaerae]